MSRTLTPQDLDATVRVDHLPAEGRELKLAANAEQLAALAERLGVSSLDRLDVSLHVAKFRGGLRVLGDLQAVVVQPCVVSFVPVRQDIDEPIDRIFLPAVSGKAKVGDDIFVDVDEEDEPDYFEGPQADLSELIIETLSLAIDPYPRAPEALVAPEGVDDDGDTDRPFAALGALRRDDADKR